MRGSVGERRAQGPVSASPCRNAAPKLHRVTESSITASDPESRSFPAAVGNSSALSRAQRELRRRTSLRGCRGAQCSSRVWVCWAVLIPPGERLGRAPRHPRQETLLGGRVLTEQACVVGEVSRGAPSVAECFLARRSIYQGNYWHRR